MSGYFDAAIASGAEPRQAANWVMGDLAAHCKTTKSAFADLKLTPKTLAELVSLIGEDVISGKIGKEVRRRCCLGDQGGRHLRKDWRGVCH